MTSTAGGHLLNRSDSKAGVRSLTILAALSTCLYGAISLLSWRFDYESVTTDRPILVVLGLFAAAFVAYLGAIRVVQRSPQNGTITKLIIAAAILFRVVMLFSLPIQEVDIYRYLWDGAVSMEGVSPFEYSPQQVSVAEKVVAERVVTERVEADDASLQRLVILRDRHRALGEILRRVHFPELPTIYPTTSQMVFAIVTFMTPPEASLVNRLFIMKAWFIGFDVATLFVVIALLRLCEKPTGLCVIYAWCPLLMKEVSNSGHLDAVAVFLTTLAVYLVARLLVRQRLSASNDEQAQASGNGPSSFQFTSIGVVLAFAVGAKMYPIVLAPLFYLTLCREFGWRSMVVPTALFAITTLILFAPMLVGDRVASEQKLLSDPISSDPISSDPISSLPSLGDSKRSDPSLGVVTFLRRWEMNDFLFLIVIENLQPTDQLAPSEVAWFTVTPESFRQSTVSFIANRFEVAPGEVPFLVARALTAVLFFVVAMVIAYRTAGKDVAPFCEAAFLTIAWFWLLCPTQNPWYWTWALPLLPFARSRAWLAVSGLVLIYYLRFWLSYHFADTTVLGTRYTGTVFYDFIVSWLEFAPWFLVLIFGYLFRRHSSI